MDFREAAELIKILKPKYTIPIHYQTIVGSLQDAYQFKALLEEYTTVKILDFKGE